LGWDKVGHCHQEEECLMCQNMCSCCPEPLDLRIESKKVDTNDNRNNDVFNEGYDSSQDYRGPPPRAYIDEPSHHHAAFHAEYPAAVYHRGPARGRGAHPGSPASDEGFVEEQNVQDNLPHFDQIQSHPSEHEDMEVEAHRPSTSRPKEKKRQRESPRDSPDSLSDKDRRKPGRKPGQVSNVLHLWEFMRDLLLAPEHSAIIEWVSRKDGVFRVVNSSEVARLWGEKKNNKKKMTYEKLSRSLRYSRLEGYFSNLPKDKNYPKKLCFKFGPKSYDWDKCFL